MPARSFSGETDRDDLRDGWLAVDPTALTVAPSSSADVLVTVNAEGLDFGDYSDIEFCGVYDPNEDEFFELDS